jgi:hypothetical protein
VIGFLAQKSGDKNRQGQAVQLLKILQTIDISAYFRGLPLD